MFGLVTIFSIGIDIDWIASDYYPVGLNESLDVFGYNFQQASSVTKQVAWHVIIYNIFLKIIILYTVMRKTTKGRNLQTALWYNLHVFCPPTSWRLPKDLSAAIQSRVIAIIWIEILCSCVLFVVAIVVQVKMNWSPQFNTNVPFVSLKHLLFLKGSSGTLFFMSILRNADAVDILAEFGCLYPCKSWYEGRKIILRRKRGFETPKVLVNGEFLKFTGVVKVFDMTVGLFIWAALVFGEWWRRNQPKYFVSLL